MPVKIHIVGCGKRRTGTGRNGKPYDLVEIHFTYPSDWIEGEACGSVVVDGDKYEQYAIRPGVDVDVILFFKQYKPDKVYFI